ncbi:hypothetical protein MJO28_007210 [Puccinia striiformis f. sp. tritici]|uniref:Uncharacterized protein n=1 Tax=Puccinia striiformis f. sp. tritici TaxID=168172 RepID=A0ACC0EE60_9BASI|nr:hypothetical protein MJO28_007210 [Puccinia striiformis f. sp. tritici]
MGYNICAPETLLSTTCPTTHVRPVGLVAAEIRSIAVDLDYSEDIDNYLDFPGEGNTKQKKKEEEEKEEDFPTDFNH